jgi:hypothetical protein
MEHDKKLHLIAGAGITAFASFVLPLGWAIVSAWAAGLGKEAYDRLNPATHTYDPEDAWITLLGGSLAGMAIHIARVLL